MFCIVCILIHVVESQHPHTCDIHVLNTTALLAGNTCNALIAIGIVCDGIVCDAILMQHSTNVLQILYFVEDYGMCTHTIKHALCTIVVVQNQHETSHTTQISSLEATPLTLSFNRHDYLVDHHTCNNIDHDMNHFALFALRCMVLSLFFTIFGKTAIQKHVMCIC